MAQFKFILWLAHWYFRSEDFNFEWDEGNLVKSSKKHGLRPDEIESVFCKKTALPLGIQIAPLVLEERFCLLGASEKGRIIFVVFTLRSHRVRPISARPASRKERKVYYENRKAFKSL